MGSIMARKFRIKADEVDIYPVLSDPQDKCIWHIIWEAYDKDKEQHKVGTVCFDGEPERGRVSLKVECEDEFVDTREARSMLNAMISWAFNQKGIYVVETVAEHTDYHKVELLQSAGFVYREGTRSIEQYSVIKEPTSWTGLYVFIGFVAGLILVVVFDHIVIGLTLGLFAGVSVGSIMDHNEQAFRSEITGEKYSANRLKYIERIRNKFNTTNNADE